MPVAIFPSGVGLGGPLSAQFSTSPAAVTAVVLSLARAVALAWGLPAFEPGGLGVTLRLVLAAFLAFCAWPLALAASVPWAVSGMSPVLLTALLLREITLGLALGFLAGRGVRAAELAGNWMGRWSQGDAPPPDVEEGTWRLLLGSLAAVLFLRLGGLSLVTKAFLQSYAAWPLVPPGALVGGRSVTALLPLVLWSAVRILESAFGLASPVLVALWGSELILGVTFRAFAFSGARELAQTARSFLPLGVVLLGLGGLLSVVEAGITDGFISVFQALTAR